MIDLDPFLSAALHIVDRHRRGRAGEYSRWTLPGPGGEARDTGNNAYGCADAANLLYTLGALPPPGEWSAWVDALRALQDPGSGLFREATHDPVHTTAHVLGALELFESGAALPLVALDLLRDAARMESALEALEWTWNPWGESHKGAGIYAALVLARQVDAAWEDRYFDWLWREADPETGLWRRGCVAAGGQAMLFHHLAGSFHYLFNHEYARRPLRYPARMIDSSLRIASDGLFPPLGQTVGFAELDWAYCIDRASRQSAHRFDECREALARFSEQYCAFLFALDPQADAGLDDLHQLLGAVSALASLQQALPGHLRSSRPLRLVLDRRPFI